MKDLNNSFKVQSVESEKALSNTGKGYNDHPAQRPFQKNNGDVWQRNVNAPSLGGRGGFNSQSGNCSYGNYSTLNTRNNAGGGRGTLNGRGSNSSYAGRSTFGSQSRDLGPVKHATDGQRAAGGSMDGSKSTVQSRPTHNTSSGQLHPVEDRFSRNPLIDVDELDALDVSESKDDWRSQEPTSASQDDAGVAATVKKSAAGAWGQSGPTAAERLRLGKNQQSTASPAWPAVEHGGGKAVQSADAQQRDADNATKGVDIDESPEQQSTDLTTARGVASDTDEHRHETQYASAAEQSMVDHREFDPTTFSCILHFVFPPVLCDKAEGKFYVRISGAATAMLSKLRDGHFWARVRLSGAHVSDVLYETFWLQKEQNKGYMSKFTDYVYSQTSFQNVERQIFKGVAKLLPQRLKYEVKFKGMVFCLRHGADHPPELQMTKFIEYVCYQKDFDREVVLRDLIALFTEHFRGKPAGLFANYGFLPQALTILDPQQSSLFPLVAAVCLGAMQHTNTQFDLCRAASFPSGAILRGLMSRDVMAVEDAHLRTLALSGVRQLLRYNIRYSLDDLAWFEKAAGDQFIPEVVQCCREFGSALPRLGPSAHQSVATMLSDFNFAGQKVELLSFLFKAVAPAPIASSTVEYQGAALQSLLLQSFFRTARCSRTNRSLTSAAETHYNAFAKELSLEELLMVARVAKTQHKARDDTIIVPLQAALLQCVCVSSLAAVQTMTIEDCNNLYLDERWLIRCFDKLLDIAPNSVWIIFDTVLVVCLDGPHRLPELTMKWVRRCVGISSLNRSHQKDGAVVAKAMNSVLVGLELIRAAAGRLAVTSPSQVVALETDLMNMVVDIFATMTIASFACIECTRSLADVFRPLSETIQPLIDHTVAWLKGKMEDFLASAAPSSEAVRRVLRAIDVPLAQSCGFTVGVIGSLLEILAKKLPAHLSYADVAPFAPLVHMIRGRDWVSREQLVQHRVFHQMEALMTELLDSIAAEDITVEAFQLLKSVTDTNNDWHSPLVGFASAYGVAVAKSTLVGCDETITAFQVKLGHVRVYLNRVQQEMDGESGVLVEALAEQVQVCAHLEGCFGKLTVKMLCGVETWGSLCSLLPLADEFYAARESQLFVSIWSREFSQAVSAAAAEDGDPASQFVGLCTSVARASDACLVEFLQSCSEPTTLRISSVTQIWIAGIVFETEYAALGRTVYEKYLRHLMVAKPFLEALTKMHIYHSVYAPGLLKVFEMFGCADGGNSGHPNLIALSSQLSEFDITAEDALLKDIVDLIVTWARAVSELTHDHHFDKFIHLLSELRNCGEVVEFLRELRDEKNVNLIDMVEENSDSIVRGETIAEFDSIRRSLRGLILLDGVQSPTSFLRALTNSLFSCTDSDPNLAVKLHSCRSQIHSIRDIWFSVAKREESTKKLCHKINDTGTVIWSRTETSEFVLVVACLNADGLAEYKDQVTVEELRSRALLLVNTAHKVSGVEEDPSVALNDKALLRNFIDMVSIAMQVTETLSELIKLGHFDYQKPLIKVKFHAEQLAELLEVIQEHKNEWESLLRSLRSQGYFMNYFFSTQFWQLHKYFSGKSMQVGEAERREARDILCHLELLDSAVGLQSFFATTNRESLAADRKKAVALLQYVDCTRSEEECLLYETCYKDVPAFAQLMSGDDDTANFSLMMLCRVLESIFGAATDADAEDSDAEQSGRSARPPIEPVSFVKYRDATGLIPLLCGVHPAGFKRHQLLICEHNTSYEEMSMFLMRVFSGGAAVAPVPLTYTVMNLQRLSHNDRASFMRLMTAAKNNRHPENTNGLVLLLLDDIAGCVDGMKLPVTTGVAASQEADIMRLVGARASNVCVVNSFTAGMGKTEYCALQASEQGRRLHTVLVTDGMSRRDLVLGVQDLALSDHHCLHLDLSNLAHESDIAIGLFELLFLGTSQIDTTIVHWDVSAPCFVERANRVSKQTSVEVDSLKFFPSRTLSWVPAAMSVNEDRDSDIQVVCNYLFRLDKGDLGSLDVVFPGKSEHDTRPATAISVSSADCQRLLAKYFIAGLSQNETPSANVLMVFLHVLAVQLRRFSSSGHFMLEYITDPSIRTAVVVNMVECTRDFATRSVVHARRRQNNNLHSGLSDDDDGSNECAGLLQWNQGDQTMVCIANESLALLYRRLEAVDKRLVQWYNSQTVASERLADYYSMSEETLRDRLSSFCGLLQTFKGRREYVLTPDNFLKCVMILLRVQAGVPVIVMGEAGCGKTSLVRFIAEMCSATLHVLSIHAGVDRQAITKELAVWIKEHSEANTESGTYRPLWIFMDEINTCNELGFINSVICHRVLPGLRIPKFVSFFAACNPFKKRVGDAKNAGLTVNSPAKGDGLVYRVKPLPETMMDYIWDFGSLSTGDERLYINQFIGQLLKSTARVISSAVNLLAELVFMSQNFIREFYDAGTVSMRDVRRVKLLFVWFLQHKLDEDRCYKDTALEKSYKCVVLTLAHCYRCRLPTTELRGKYDKAMAEHFASFGVRSMTDVRIAHIIRNEQHGYLREMTVPEGIALNDSLVENVFVLLVCILNKIPVFIVGKPGSSKSLSIVLINSNMRGKDSDSAFFKTLPEVKIICFQGSESSTSDGILKIFRKAKGFVVDANGNDGGREAKNVIPVVLIDEIGLAEISPFNPLKVLHSQLETDDDRPLDIAVIGISNWELDLSKMSRAVYLARPEPNVHELEETAIKIVDTICFSKTVLMRTKLKLRELSALYIRFCSQEEISHPNFHGLRDFYSTCKYLGHVLKNTGDITTVEVSYALLRNFGGLRQPLSSTAFKPFFDQAVKERLRMTDVADTSVTALVADNLRDKNARHLMLISEGDSILNVIGDLFEAAGVTSYRIIVGSKFSGDKSENYRYRMLSEIILCMERGESLALRDLDDIYQSLYDMLNQNYTVVAGKKNCRVALGAFSNPMAHVHDDFKCIVIPDAKKVYKLDPPFLNRFEKHVIDFDHVLLPAHHKVVETLAVWIEFMCKVQNSVDRFTVRDTFVGYSSTGTLNSLVLTVASQLNEARESELLEACKEKLLRTATFQGVVRALSSHQSMFDSSETRRLFESYVADKKHISLKHFVEETISSGGASAALTSKSIVSTYSNFYFLDVEAHQLPDSVKLAYSKLSAFDTELGLSNFVRQFFGDDSEQNVLIVQCDVVEDADKLMLTKFIIDKEVREYKDAHENPVAAVGGGGGGGGEEVGDDALQILKHVIILLHTKSELFEDDRLSGYELYFSGDWEDFHIDNLEQDDDSWAGVCRIIAQEQTMAQYLSEHPHIFDDCFKNDLVSCFRHIKYMKGCSAARITSICGVLAYDSPALQQLLRDKIMAALMENPQYHSRDWLLQVASARENLEFSSSSLTVAVNSFLASVFRGYLAQCVYLFEKYSAFDSYLGRDRLPEYHINVFLHAAELNLSNVPPLGGAECYEVGLLLDSLQSPFSALLESRMDEIKHEFGEAMRANTLDDRRLRNYNTELMTAVKKFGEETRTTDLFNQKEYCADAIRLFIGKESTSSYLAYPLVERVVLSLLELLNFSESTADMLYPLLWSRAALIASMVSLVDVRGDLDGALNVATFDEIQQLCDSFGKPVDIADSVIPAAVYSLCVDFCSAHWSSITGEAFTVHNVVSWAETTQRKVPHFVNACEQVGFTFDFSFLDDEEDDAAEIDAFNMRLMPYYLNLQVVTDLCKLLQSVFRDEDSAPDHSVMSVLEGHFCAALPPYMDSGSLNGFMMFIDLLSSTLPEQAHRSLVAFRYKTLKRFMLLPTDNGRDTLLLFSSDVYVNVGRCLTMDAQSPPLVCRELVTILVEKLFATLFEIHNHDAVAELDQGFFTVLRDFDHVASLAGKLPVIEAFQSLFQLSEEVLDIDDSAGGIVSAQGTKLEIMMTDMLVGHLADMPELDYSGGDECDCFAAIVTRWKSDFDQMGIVERMFGAAFCRLFLDNYASQLSQDDSSSVGDNGLCETIEKVLGADRPQAIYHVLRIYVLKAMRLPVHELRSACITGAWLHRKAPWVAKYAWLPDKVVSRLLPVRAKERDEEVRLAWDEMFYPHAPSDEKMKALLGALSEGDSDVLKGVIAAAFAAKCWSESPNNDASDIAAILAAWPAHADSRWKSLFQAVHSRFTVPSALPVSDFDIDDVCLLNIVVSLMNADSEQFRQCVFGTYMSDATAVQSSYMMGAHSSDLAAVMRAHGGGIGYYRCPCGFVYEIEDCTKPNGVTRACDCGRVLGGHNHEFTEAGTTKVELDLDDPRGHYFPTEHSAVEDYTVRGLTRIEYRVLSILVHSCILVGLYHSPGGFATAVHCDGESAGNDAVRLSWQWMKDSWTVLCRALALEGDRKELICALIMQLIQEVSDNATQLSSALDTVALREETEMAFTRLCSPLLDAFAQSSIAALDQWREPAANGERVFEREIQERDAPITFLPNVFRLLRPPRTEDIRNAYFASAAVMLQHPVVGVYLKYETELHRIQDMYALLKWPQSIRKLLNFELALTDIAVSTDAVLSLNYQLDRKEYEDFEAAWNRFYDVSPNVDFDRAKIPDCHALKIEKLAATDSILFSCARLSHIGREAPYMAHVLGEIQNRFLADVFAVRPNYRGAELKKPLQDVSKSNLVAHDSAAMWMSIGRSVRANLDYGAGCQLECDWEQIEALINKRLVDGKTLLWTDIQEPDAFQTYRYKQELFQDQRSLFAMLHDMVPQASGLPDAEGIRGDPSLSDVGVVDTKLFPALNNVIFVLLKQRTTVLCGDQTLLEFVSAHMDNEVYWQQLSNRQSAVVSLSLRHIEALYETMEDVISTTVLGCLHANFKQDIEGSLFCNVLQHLVPLVGDLSALESCFRRFIIRCLRNPDSIKPAEQFLYYLELVRWPNGVDMRAIAEGNQVVEGIFSELLIGHTGTVHQLLQQEIYEIRLKEQSAREDAQSVVAASGADASAAQGTGGSTASVGNAGTGGGSGVPPAAEGKKIRATFIRPKGQKHSM